MSKVKKIAKIFLGLPLTVAAFFFIGKILFDSKEQIISHLGEANLTLLLLGILFMLLFFLIRAIAWTKILTFFGESEKDGIESVYLYSLAETKRYIPGNIFSFVSRVQKFTSKSLTKRILIKSLFLEAFVMVFSALIISLPAIFGVINPRAQLVFIAVVTILVLIVAGIFFKKSKKIKTIFFSLFPNKSVYSYINVILLSSLAWFFFGLGNYLFASSIFPNNPNLILTLASIFVLSWLVGYLSFIFPMGLGVREAILIYLLSPFFPVYMGAAIALFTRILFMLSEVIFLLLAFIGNKKSKYIRKLDKSSALLVVAFTSFLYISYFTFFSITKHANFYTGKFDLGNMENTIWNTINGRIFVFSNPDGTGELLRLSAHSDFILLFFSPLYAIYPSANLLLITQTAIIGLGGFFIYLISEKILKNPKISLVLSIGYYLNFFIQEQNLFDFHAVSLATPFLLGGFYFFLIKKYRLTLFMLILAILTKENVYLVSAIFGAFIFLQGKKAFGTILFFLSILGFYLLMSVFIPMARSEGHFALSYLSYLGSSPLEIILSPILKPAEFFSRIFSYDTLNYIRIAFLPVGYLSFLSPLYLLFLLPDFLINVLSDNPNLRSIQYHYGALLVPFIYISAIYGVRKILSLKLKFINKDTIFYYLLFFTLLSTWFFSPLPGMKNSDTSAFRPVKDREIIFSEIEKIPANKSVSATNNIAAHLVQREKIYVIPQGIDTSDYLVFYKNDLDLMEELLIYRSDFVPVFKNEDFGILKRINLPEKAYTL